MNGHDKKRRLVFWARVMSSMGIHEEGGNNQGPAIEFFQMLADGIAAKEAWCLSFARGLVRLIDDEEDAVRLQSAAPSPLSMTEHCLTLWRKSEAQRAPAPEPGCLVLWRHGESDQGHAGVVVEVDIETGTFWSVEGNTSQGPQVEREGDGVRLRQRGMAGLGKMKVLGFLDPWKE